jgi:hypothetical protein
MTMNTNLRSTLLLLATLLMLCSCSDEEPTPTDPAESSNEASLVGDSAEADADGETQAPNTDEDSEDTGATMDSRQAGNTTELAWQKVASPLTSDLSTAFVERCSDDDGASLECEMLRSLVVIDVVMALEEIERSRDQRGAGEALAALDLDEEPEILVAALRVLGQFPDTPGIAEKVLPLILQSPWLMVQELAARVLQANPDPQLAAVGSLWSGNHGSLYADNEYSEYPGFPGHYSDMEFPEYPEAEWFSPADSDRSIGWTTTDDTATVIAWMREELDTEPLDFTQWSEHSQAQWTAAMQSVDQSKQARMEQLIEEYTKTQDMALLEEVQKLQAELSAPMEKAARVMDMGVNNITPPSAAGTIEATRFFIAEERDGHVARLVVVYPLEGLKRTVIQEAWNLLDYPSAWPPAADEPPGD